jgi:hypothetical protein
MAETENSSRPTLRRGVAAGGVGFVLPFVAWGAAAALLYSPVLEWICPTGGLECLAPPAYFGLAVAVAMGWPLLLLARVRPAWPVALLGSLLSAVLIAVIVYSQQYRLFRSLVVVACAVSYTVAALVVAKLKTTWRKPRRG